MNAPLSDGLKSMENLPYIPLNLLKALNERYPERSPDPMLSEREIWMLAGERRLIRSLNILSESQNENILNPTKK